MSVRKRGLIFRITTFGTARIFLLQEDQEYYEGIIKFLLIKVKINHTGEPLIGSGKVVEWLKNNKSVYSSSERQDNRCFWRCLAVFFSYQGRVCWPTIFGNVCDRSCKALSWPKVSDSLFEKGINGNN